MSIFDYLRNDHVVQRDLLRKLAETSGDCDVLYSRMMTGKGRAKAVHSVAEHKAMRDQLKELREMDMSSPAWLPKLRTLPHPCPPRSGLMPGGSREQVHETVSGSI